MMNGIYKWLLNYWAVLVAVVSVSVIAYQGTDLMLRLGHLWTPALVVHSGGIGRSKTAQLPQERNAVSALASLLQVNWWGHPAQVLSADAHQSTTLPLVLQGVFQRAATVSGVAQAGALIAPTGQTQAKMYHLGDDLGGGVLVGLGDRGVQIRRSDGHLESLNMSQHPPLLVESTPMGNNRVSGKKE